jgi:hypothetical protein
MKIKIFFLFLIGAILNSCASNFYSEEKEIIGFANVVNSEKIYASLDKGRKYKIINSYSNNSIIVTIDEKLSENNKRIIFLPEKFFSELKLNKSNPLVSIVEEFSNPVFVAAKVKTYDEEKKVNTNVVTPKVSILSLDNSNSIDRNVFFIQIGPYYFEKSMNQDYDKIEKNLNNKISIERFFLQNKLYMKIGPLNNVKQFDNLYTIFAKNRISDYKILIK